MGNYRKVQFQSAELEIRSSRISGEVLGKVPMATLWRPQVACIWSLDCIYPFKVFKVENGIIKSALQKFYSVSTCDELQLQKLGNQHLGCCKYSRDDVLPLHGYRRRFEERDQHLMSRCMERRILGDPLLALLGAQCYEPIYVFICGKSTWGVEQNCELGFEPW